MTPALNQLVPLAEELDKNKVTPGVLGFLVFAAIGLALWLLLKNMNKQFKKIDFDEGPEDGPGTPPVSATGPRAPASGAPTPDAGSRSGRPKG